MAIQDVIKKRRLELNLTLKDVADALGVAESTVSRYETSYIASMKVDKLKALANVLQCSPDYLIGANEPPAPNAELAELLVTIKNTPHLLQLNKDFLELNQAQQETVLALIHSMIPDKHPV